MVVELHNLEKSLYTRIQSTTTVQSTEQNAPVSLTVFRQFVAVCDTACWPGDVHRLLAERCRSATISRFVPGTRTNLATFVF